MDDVELATELDQAAGDAECLVGHLYSRGFVVQANAVRDRANKLRARLARIREYAAEHAHADGYEPMCPYCVAVRWLAGPLE